MDTDPTVAQAADEFDVRFCITRDALRAELTETGEVATIRRALDSGSALERGALLTLLGHKILVVKVSSSDEEAARARDARVRAFLLSLIDAEPLRPQRPVLEATDEDLAVLRSDDAHAALQLVDDHHGWPTCPTT
jgi:hypothetical protein